MYLGMRKVIMDTAAANLPKGYTMSNPKPSLIRYAPETVERTNIV